MACTAGKRLLSALLGVAAAGLAASPATAAPGELIVRFDRGVEPAERSAARDRADVVFERRLGAPRLQLVRAEPGLSPARAIAALERSGDVAYAEPDVRRAALSALSAPSDPFFGLQWGLDNTGQLVAGLAGLPDADIDAPEAWSITTGSPSVTVAVVDGGVEASHPDLAPNLWSNRGESGGGRESNGIDDDGNGYVDDSAGWDWVDGDRRPEDENGHGTHVAGTLGARGDDGVGVAGVGWNARVMALRVLDADGAGFVSDAILAYDYAVAHGARVVNLSLGGPDVSLAERDLIAASPGTLFVAAAGNDGEDNDAVPSYPCAHPLPNVICVAASDSFDELAPFSNYGATSVDLAAPGDSIASSVPGDWGYSTGTSMAAPHVAGAAALVWAADPSATVAEVKAALMDGADEKPAFAGVTVSGGRLNVYGALREVATAAPAPPPVTQPAPAPAPAPASTVPAPAPTAPAPTLSADPAVPRNRTTSPRPRWPVVVPARQRLSRVLRRGLTLRAKCSAPCRLRIRVRLGRRILVRRTVTLAMGRRTVLVRLPVRARRLLKRLGGARLRVDVRASGGQGSGFRASLFTKVA